MRVLIFILTYVVSSMASSISSPSITTEYATYPSFVVTSSPLPACPSNALCAHTVCIEEVHVLGTKTVTEVTTVVSTLIKPVTSWSTITSTVTVPGKDCTVTSHRVTSKYDTATVSLTETSFVTIDSVVYATKTVIETVSQLCEAATGPTLPISTGDPIPVTTDGPQPIVTGGPDSSAAQSSVTIVEWEADYVTAWTVASLTLSTQIPLPIPRTATVDENPNPGRVTLPQCAREGKLTYSFLQGYGWDNVDFNKPSDPITDFTFGPISFKAMNWKYLDKPNIIEQGTHPVLQAITGKGAFTLVNPAEAAKLQQFAIELPENAELVGVSLQFAFHVSHTTGDPFTWNFNMDGGSYGKSLSPSWTFTNLGIDLSDLPQNSWPALMTLTRTDTGAFVPFHLRQVLLCEG